MSTMYIACNHCTEHECFLGDVIIMIKAAYLFVENEPHEELLLSLFEHEPLNFLWQKFIEIHRVRVVWDDWPKKDTRIPRSRRRERLYCTNGMCVHYRHLQKRIDTHQIHGIPFDTYKELYPWRFWSHRQRFLCDSPRFLREMNVLEGYYFGQQQYASKPRQTKQFIPGLIECQREEPARERSVFIAPHEQCQMNRIFTLEFWEEVVSLLLKEDVHVILNTRNFMIDLRHPRLEATFEPTPAMINQIASQQLVVCGNTGVGWVAASTGTPFIAMEKDMIMEEYSYEKCGCQSLMETVREPDPRYAAKTILRHL